MNQKKGGATWEAALNIRYPINKNSKAQLVDFEQVRA
jgi:hypothetical protein